MAEIWHGVEGGNLGGPIVHHLRYYTLPPPPAPVIYSPPAAPVTIPAYACDLAGVPLPYYSVFDLAPETPGEPLVSLARLIVMSLFTDRTALSSDTIPDGTADPRGWWADAYNEDGSQFGSRLWLLMGQPTSEATAANARAYADEALRWMIADGLVSSIETEAEIRGTGQDRTLALGVTAIKGDGSGVRLTWPDLWAALEG